MKRIDVAPVVMKRTEEGKRLRKAYEAGKIHHGFNEHRVMSVHWGGRAIRFLRLQKIF